MIIHQDIGVNASSKALAQFRQQLEEMKAVRVAVKDVLAFVSRGSHMVTAGRRMRSARAMMGSKSGGDALSSR